MQLAVTNFLLIIHLTLLHSFKILVEPNAIKESQAAENNRQISAWQESKYILFYK